jgi:RNA-directed DNA polymerase
MTLSSVIGEALILPDSYVEQIANTASYRYKEFHITKRNGTLRAIHHPSKQLKAIQRALLSLVVSRFPVHPSALAYRTGINGPLRHARTHEKSRYLLRMDFREFFASIKGADISSWLTGNQFVLSTWPWWTPADTKLVVALVCRKGELTIGAPTSPSLSNAICFDLDLQLAEVATQRGATYSRYADDICFSTDAPNVLREVESDVEETVNGLGLPAGLRINESKTAHISKRRRRVLTGLVLSSVGTTSIGREAKRRIRAMVDQVETLTPEERASLAGWLSHCHGVDPDYLNRLQIKYGERLVRARSHTTQTV